MLCYVMLCYVSSLDTSLPLRLTHGRRDELGSCRARSPALHVGRRDRVASCVHVHRVHPAAAKTAVFARKSCAPPRISRHRDPPRSKLPLLTGRCQRYQRGRWNDWRIQQYGHSTPDCTSASRVCLDCRCHGCCLACSLQSDENRRNPIQQQILMQPWRSPSPSKRPLLPGGPGKRRPYWRRCHRRTTYWRQSYWVASGCQPTTLTTTTWTDRLHRHHSLAARSRVSTARPAVLIEAWVRRHGPPPHQHACAGLPNAEKCRIERLSQCRDLIEMERAAVAPQTPPPRARVHGVACAPPARRRTEAGPMC